LTVCQERGAKNRRFDAVGGSSGAQARGCATDVLSSGPHRGRAAGVGGDLAVDLGDKLVQNLHQFQKSGLKRGKTRSGNLPEREKAESRQVVAAATAPGRKKNTSGKSPEVSKAMARALEPEAKKEAKKRQVDSGKKHGRGRQKKGGGKIPQPKSRQVVAAATGRSEKTLRDALRTGFDAPGVATRENVAHAQSSWLSEASRAEHAACSASWRPPPRRAPRRAASGRSGIHRAVYLPAWPWPGRRAAPRAPAVALPPRRRAAAPPRNLDPPFTPKRGGGRK